MPKLTGLMIAGSLTTFLLIGLVGTGVWLFARNQFAAVPTPPAAVPVEAVTADPRAAEMATLQQTVQQRSQTYQQQLTTLQATLQARQTTYQTQLTQAAGQLNDYNTTISRQQQTLDALKTQVAQFEQSLTQRQTGYQAQLTQTQAELQARADQLAVTLQEGQAALAAANAQLGR